MNFLGGVRIVGIGLMLTGLLACEDAPPREPCALNSPLGSVCGFENPEDVAWAPSQGLLISGQLRFGDSGGTLLGFDPVSQQVSRLWPRDNVASGAAGEEAGAEAAAKAVPAPTQARALTEPAAAAGEKLCVAPKPALFAPHGVYADAAGHLLVVNHGGRESVEIFQLEGQGASTRANWQGCILLPEGTSGNDVALASDGAIVVSNFASSMDSTFAGLKMLLGRSTGDMMIWQEGPGWQHIPGTTASGPNGIALSPDGQTIFYSETGAGRVVRMQRDGTRRVDVKIPGLSDNLSWTPEGKLLLASHESAMGFASCRNLETCRAPWRVDEIDPATMEVREILVHDGSVVGAVATAQQVGNQIYLGAVFGDRIGVLERTPD